MSLLVAMLLAQVSLSEEGGARKVVNHIDCVGAGITCSTSSTFGTITVPGGGGGSAPAACSSGQATTSNGSALVCTSTLNASDVTCSGTCVSDAEIAAVSGSKVSGAVSSATALAADPTDCAATQFATNIAANGNLTCATPPNATAVAAGYVSTGTQTWSGSKVFNTVASFTDSTYTVVTSPATKASLISAEGIAVDGPVTPATAGRSVRLLGNRSLGDTAAGVTVENVNWIDGGALFQVNSAYPCNAGLVTVTADGVYYGGSSTPACTGTGNADTGALVHASGVSGGTSMMAMSKQYLVLKGRLADNQDAIQPDGGQAPYDGGTWVVLLADGGTRYQYAGRHGEVTVVASGPKYGGFLFEAKNAITGGIEDKVFAVGPFGGISNVSGQTRANFHVCPGVNILTSLGQYFYGAQPGELAYGADTDTWYTCRATGWKEMHSDVASVAQGGTGSAPAGSDQVLVSTSTSAATWRTLPNCSNATTSKLLYDSSTDTFSCGTDQTGGGGSANFVSDAFTFADSSDALKTVTAAWATPASNIMCGPLGEEESVEDLRVTAISRASGSFVARGYVPVGRHTGTMNFRCTGD